jgi:hypothetical protein
MLIHSVTMQPLRLGTVLTVSIATALCCVAPGLAAESAKDLVREALLQQSPAQATGCTGVQRTLKSGADATLVVRTAVEMGFNACQVIRCALEEQADPGKAILCERVVRGAVLAGVQPDVISRCSAEYCDPAAVAVILGDAFLETNYCYFASQPLTAPDVPPPRPPVIDRTTQPPQASPFRF